MPLLGKGAAHRMIAMIEQRHDTTEQTTGEHSVIAIVENDRRAMISADQRLDPSNRGLFAERVQRESARAVDSEQLLLIRQETRSKRYLRSVAKFFEPNSGCGEAIPRPARRRVGAKSGDQRDT